MCGLAGLLRSDAGHRRRSPDRARRARWAMRCVHRGPDDSGVWVDDAGGHRARAPSAEHPRPVAAGPSADGLGRSSLRHRLQRRDLQLRRPARSAGRAWAMRSAAIPIPKCCWPRWWSGASRRRSRVATACSRSRLWDRQERCLWLARDRVGKKPLYYGWAGDTLRVRFRTQGAVAATRTSTTAVDRDALALLLRLDYIPAPHAIHVDTFKLMPGAADARGCRQRRGRRRRRTIPERDQRRYWDARERMDAAHREPVHAAMCSRPRTGWMSCCVRPSPCAWWPTCRWACSCRAAPIRRSSPR